MPTVRSELRDMLPAWALAVLLPAPLSTFWQDGSGRAFAYAYLFLGCSLLAAERFSRFSPASGDAVRLWRTKMAALLIATAGAVIVFTAFAWSVSGQPEGVVPLLAVLAVTPALACVPYLTLATGRPYAAVLFTIFLLAAVKLAGCAVVRVVYGPDALAEGHMALPWEQPNLLVWLCLAGALALSALLYPLGRRAFVRWGIAPQ